MNLKNIFTPLFSLTILGFSVLAACSSEGNNDTYIAKTLSEPIVKNNVSDIPTRYKKAERIIAIGDLHGDFHAAVSALKLAGVINSTNHWVGGKTVVVQTGDQLDRGDGEKEITDLLENLAIEAKNAGGAIHVLNGNHEIMNVAQDLRYVTKEGFEDFSKLPGQNLEQPFLIKYPVIQRPRVAAFAPGGSYARILGKRNTIVVVGNVIFVHGGILPQYVKYGLEKINHDVQQWMTGQNPNFPAIVGREDSPVWSRLYSDNTDKNACSALDEALRNIPARYMVVGHTVQTQGINSACDGHVWRIDVGMSKFYGGPVQVLEIKDNQFKVLKSTK